MIEKIMKTVKSGNKKRGRNITIGAVVGMLLSCTAVMGVDVVGLEIEESSGNITFIPSIDEDTYSENTWDEESKTYTNNSRISVENNNDSAYGLKLSGDLSEASFINNGSISVTVSERGTGYGIYNEAGNIGSIINTGSIFGNTKGIYNFNSSTIGEIINIGSIISIGNNGIYNNKSSRIGSIINSGTISSGMNGIYNYDFNGTGSSIGEIINSGTISANAGIANADSSNSIERLTNRGIIYGQDVTIVSSGGTISNAFNYGLLVSGNTFKSVIKGVTIVDSSASALNDNEIKNYGLAFTVDSSTNEYIGGGKNDSGDSNPSIDYHNNFGKIHQNISIDGVSYDIINVDAEVDNTSKEITDWKSLNMKDGKLYSDADDIAGSEISDFSPDKKYILNGIENTLKISG
ncbi:MAG: autotransporter domain-containing protein, partial [Fusobacterium ulcerans]